MVPFSFAGHELAALAEGALFWPARKALIVADLHLEKASWFAKGGQMLPPYDSQATLTELTALAQSTGAAELWCLGDSFHDREGCERLPDSARRMLTGLTGSLRWVWITGNHDAGLVDHCGGEIMIEAEIDGLMLRHEAEGGEARPDD
jgi:DNA ligase-associated metallophosphoesterase